MVKSPPEKLAAALRANLKRRKQHAAPAPDPKSGKAPENIMENGGDAAARPARDS
jgi:hypothetical protein